MESDMNREESTSALTEYRHQIADIRAKMRDIQAAVEPQPVSDYTFETTDGPTRLADLFGVKDDLIVIHNMGTGCAYCTLWADGFNGLYPHLANRAAFFVCSPDAPETQRRFAAARGWHFPMVSHRETSFAADMGYRSETGGWLPGVSVFRRDEDRIVRVANTGFGPHDEFCAMWHFLDLLPGGAEGWSPKFNYG
jgi:predicted dithiol-disulfide oxidoreductase (DUF899 family)